MDYPCSYCQYNKGETSNHIDCSYYGVITRQEHCAALCLTSEGWEFCAKAAKEQGEVQRANAYYQRAIELQEPEISTC